MKNLVLVAAMFGVLVLALGWVAFTGFGTRSSDAPPVVIDFGSQHQMMRTDLPAPEVSLRSEPFSPSAPSPASATTKSAVVPPPISKVRRPRSGHLVRKSVQPLANGKIEKLRKSRANPPEPSPRQPLVRPRITGQDKERVAKLEPSAHFVPSVPAAEHYAPRLDSSDTGVREIPIAVRRESPPSASEAELEANREWRRKILDRWAREESRSLSQGIRQHQATTSKRAPAKPKREKPAKAKKRSRHRLLFISW